MEDYEISFIREIERTVLDRYYKNYELLSWKDDFVIPYFLKVLGDILRDLKAKESNPISPYLVRRELNLYIQALGWCIKWILLNENQAKKSKLSDTLLTKKIKETLAWAFNYHILVQNHVAWTRGYMNVEMNKNEKEINFLAPDLEIFQFMLSQELNSQVVADDSYNNLPIQEISEYYSQRRMELNWNNPPFQFNWAKAKNDYIFLPILKWTEKSILPEVENHYDLGTYTVGDLRTFFAGMFIHTALIVFAEQEIDERTNYEM